MPAAFPLAKKLQGLLSRMYDKPLGSAWIASLGAKDKLAASLIQKSRMHGTSFLKVKNASAMIAASLAAKDDNWYDQIQQRDGDAACITSDGKTPYFR